MADLLPVVADDFQSLLVGGSCHDRLNLIVSDRECMRVYASIVEQLRCNDSMKMEFNF